MEKKTETSNKLKKAFNLWLPPFLWAIVIFLFSSYPTTRASEIHWQDFIVKKTAHIVEFGFLSLLLYRGFINSGMSKRKAGCWAIHLSILYAVTDEFHQMFTPGREPTVRDVLFDTIGAVVGIYIIWKLLPKAPKRLKNWAKKLELI